MRSELNDAIRLQHILDAIEEIESYLADAGFDFFMQNSMMRFACIKQLEIIGEASNHISVDLKLKFYLVEWAQIVGMRNVFAHEYFGIDTSLVWEIVKEDIPELKQQIRQVLESVR